jgi:S1-C subfamily serine protease
MAVAETPVGKKVEVEVFRNGKTQKLSLTIGNADSAQASQPRSAQAEAGWLGLTVEELPQNKRLRGLAGVMVTNVDPGGVAAEAGIQRGDIIVSANQRRIANLDDYAKAMKEAERKGSVALLVKRGEASIYFALKIR